MREYRQRTSPQPSVLSSDTSSATPVVKNRPYDVAQKYGLADMLNFHSESRTNQQLSAEEEFDRYFDPQNLSPQGTDMIAFWDVSNLLNFERANIIIICRMLL